MPTLARRERAVMMTVRTPREAQRWLDALDMNTRNIGRTLRSFRGVVEHGAAHCIEGALAAAFVLERGGRELVLVDLRSDDLLDHVVLAWRDRGRKWGAVGKSDIPGLQGRKAVYRSLRDLAWSYVDPYVDGAGRVRGYATLDLRALELKPTWGLSARGLWRIEQALRARRTRRLRASSARHARVLAAYRAWVRAHLGAEPPAAFFRDGDAFLGSA